MPVAKACRKRLQDESWRSFHRPVRDLKKIARWRMIFTKCCAMSPDISSGFAVPAKPGKF
jgi:hypothetical protein